MPGCRVAWTHFISVESTLRPAGGSGEIERLEDEVARAQAARISAEAALQHALMAKEGGEFGVWQAPGGQRWGVRAHGQGGG